MGSEGSFLVEDFINAITTQLDRVQDSLRLKAVNRPLTYALKDIALDLQVFVDVDPQGNVRFRSGGPNEAGASTIRLGFTTITRPMIEENTVSLAMTRSPQLDELGLDEDEKRRLEQYGVRNAAQLQNLGRQTSATGVSRLTGIPVDRLREALSLGRPRIDGTAPQPVNKPPVVQQPPRPLPPVVQQPPVVHQPPVVQHPPTGPIRPPVQTKPPVFTPPKQSPIFTPPVVGFPSKPVTGSIKIAPGAKKLELFGGNLLSDDGTPEVRLNNRPLNVSDVDEDRLVIDMPDQHEGGALDVILPGGEQMSFDLSYEDESLSDDRDEYRYSAPDSWEPDN